ncbi:uncharacterized protein [Spinacia oleracea]|uniref:Endonuclease/exonuclease/phosphatase domain-containing protein n=1 Tax=Spinacia oleracea TaxID=3562 RepID=A0A9R0J4A4_SPIOL|nr:uncharacterized protein LOC110800006 [Spinacia oleracea]
MLPVHIVTQKLSAFQFAGSCGCDAQGLSGGLFLGWFPDVHLVPLLVSSNFVFCKYSKNVNEISHVLFLYGAPHVSNRGRVWEEISVILADYPRVVLVGDFNQVEFLDDKMGGSTHIPQRNQFMQWRLDHELQSIPFSGPSFTWTNGHHDNSVSFERLDKAYASSSWLLDFPDAGVTHQPILFSDHAAIILRYEPSSGSVTRPYRVDSWCLQAKEVVAHIILLWQQHCLGSLMFSLSSKLSALRRFLLSWCVSHRRAWGINWRELTTAVSAASYSVMPGISASLFISSRDEHVSRAQATFMYWKQRSKVRWDVMGDSPSKLFFLSVQARKRRNRITGLCNDSNQWVDSPPALRSLILDYYSDLYQTHGPASTSLDFDWDQLQLPHLLPDQI